ncbi:hypothetical protein E2C01_066419 [Portunus trituberculatus]|uniref:Uncharacterized protein n=1 Tax=Portunus trituberculatus TaxID=210409 RepID=A0A5B7HQZ9_PORTR|nr:hypothetical protein [Portunus trituberculatus]
MCSGDVSKWVTPCTTLSCVLRKAGEGLTEHRQCLRLAAFSLVIDVCLPREPGASANQFSGHGLETASLVLIRGTFLLGGAAFSGPIQRC